MDGADGGTVTNFATGFVQLGHSGGWTAAGHVVVTEPRARHQV
jgi:hypothetical protein